MKKVIIIILMLFMNAYLFPLKIKTGIEISGHIIPYFSVTVCSYKNIETELGTGFFVMKGKNYLFEPFVKIKYFTDPGINLELNTKIIKVSSEKRILILSGIGAGYNFLNDKLNISAAAEIMLPFSAVRKFGGPVPMLTTDYLF